MSNVIKFIGVFFVALISMSLCYIGIHTIVQSQWNTQYILLGIIVTAVGLIILYYVFESWK